MAGRGPAPKDPALRRNTAAPQRGEWVTIPASHDGPVPKLPTRRRGEGAWTAGTQRAWRGWWQDGASLHWTSADHESVVMLARLVQAVEEGELKHAAEVRIRMDGLGLTPKGKRDLRFRVADDVPTVAAVAPVAELEDRRARRRSELSGEG